MKKFQFEFDEKLDVEVCKDILALKEKCAKAYHFTAREKHDFYWMVMIGLSKIITKKENERNKEKK